MLTGKTNIGTKRMGDLDQKVFVNACKKRFSDQEEAGIKGVELCSMWQENVKNTAWHPFKNITKNDTLVVCIIQICFVLVVAIPQ